MSNAASGDTTSGDKTKPEKTIFERNHDAMEPFRKEIENDKPRPDPAPRKEPTAK